MKYLAGTVAFFALALALFAFFEAKKASGRPVHVHDSPVAAEGHVHSSVARHTHTEGDLQIPKPSFQYVMSDQFPNTAGDPDNNVHVPVTSGGERLLQSNSVCFLSTITGGFNDNSHKAVVEKDGDGWRIHIIGANIGARAGCVIFK